MSVTCKDCDSFPCFCGGKIKSHGLICAGFKQRKPPQGITSCKGCLFDKPWNNCQPCSGFEKKQTEKEINIALQVSVNIALQVSVFETWLEETSKRYDLNLRDYFKENEMDKIEIDVRVNGKPAKLSDISDETLANIKKSEVKPIEHGDYGFLDSSSTGPRFFFEIGGVVKAYNKKGVCCAENANNVDRFMCPSGRYQITGNIFKDLKNARKPTWSM